MYYVVPISGHTHSRHIYQDGNHHFLLKESQKQREGQCEFVYAPGFMDDKALNNNNNYNNVFIFGMPAVPCSTAHLCDLQSS
jgi:hypothetical protein